MNSSSSPSDTPKVTPSVRILYLTIITGLLALVYFQSQRIASVNALVASTAPAEGAVTQVSLQSQIGEKAIFPDPVEVPLLAAIESADIETADSAMHFLTESEKTETLPPLEVDALLSLLKKQAHLPDCSLSSALSQIEAQNPNRDIEKVINWAAAMAGSSLGASYEIASQFRSREDLAPAFYWYQKSAEDTSAPESFYQVGSAQLHGRGTSTNYTEARENLTVAASGGHGDAAWLLGISSFSGLGTAPDKVKARSLFVAAVENGSRFACGELARMNELGAGIQQDLLGALGLYVEGAQKGDRYCMEKLVELSSPKGRKDPHYESVFGRYWKAVHQRTEQVSFVEEARQLLPDAFL